MQSVKAATWVMPTKSGEAKSCNVPTEANVDVRKFNFVANFFQVTNFSTKCCTFKSFFDKL